jgi:hypothetical protein
MGVVVMIVVAVELVAATASIDKLSTINIDSNSNTNADILADRAVV